MEEYLTECKDLIRKFLSLAVKSGDILKEDIGSLSTFNFKDLKKTIYNVRPSYRVYKNHDKNGIPHDDSSRLARLIYYVLWGNHEYTDYKLSNLTHVDSCFDAGENNFGGDTLITTVAFDGDTTIGNFMVLPKGKASNGKTINQYRGVGSGFEDDFCKFMNILKDLYKKKHVEDAIWKELFDNKNNTVFFGSIGNFSNFERFFMLEDWDKLSPEEFVKQRSERICERLKKLF